MPVELKKDLAGNHAFERVWLVIDHKLYVLHHKETVVEPLIRVGQWSQCWLYSFIYFILKH